MRRTQVDYEELINHVIIDGLSSCKRNCITISLETIWEKICSEIRGNDLKQSIHKYLDDEEMVIFIADNFYHAQDIFETYEFQYEKLRINPFSDAEEFVYRIIEMGVCDKLSTYDYIFCEYLTEDEVEVTDEIINTLLSDLEIQTI